MKKLAFLILALAAVSANAQARCCWRGGYWGGGWVAPAIVGGVVGYELAQPRTVIVEQQPVIVQQPQVTQVLPAAPAGYHYQQMLNTQTNQYQMVLVPN